MPSVASCIVIHFKDRRGKMDHLAGSNRRIGRRLGKGPWLGKPVTIPTAFIILLHPIFQAIGSIRPADRRAHEIGGLDSLRLAFERKDHPVAECGWGHGIDVLTRDVETSI